MSGKPANDNDPASIARHVQPITVSSATCLAITGMSWTWVLRFARAHGVPVWRVGERKQLVPAPQLAAAMARAVDEAPARTMEDELADIEREVVAKFGNRRR